MSQSLSFRSFAPTKSKPSLIDHKPYASLSRRVSISAVHSEVRSKPNHLTADVSRHAPPVQPRPPVYPSSMLDAYSALEVDRITEAELKENGFESVRRTKVVCTVGTSSCGFDELEALAAGGMNVARLNLGHNTQDWHREVIRRVRRLNAEKGFAVAVMVDTQGSEIHMGDLDGGKSSARAKDGDIWTFSIRSYDTSLPERTVNVSYDGFAEDVQVGDELLVDGGMVRFEVIEKIGPDVKCLCIDPGLLLPRANLALWRDARLVHHHDAMLPTITQKDWHDIDFAIAEGVDFIALSFIRYAEAIHQLRSYIVSNSLCRKIGVIAKIESIDSLKNLEEIVEASDGVMVARGDMGAQIALERVPLAQERIVRLCKGMNKPVIVASQLLESMIEYPIPTRAEVADVSDAVRQQADALMLSGESAMGRYPEKALAVLRDVSLRIEKWQREQEDKHRYNVNDVSAAAFSSSPGGVREALCDVAAKMADSLGADAIFVYTKDGEMATRLSKCRPLRPIFAFTESSDVRRRLNLAWGVIPLQLSFSNNSDKNFSRTFSVLKTRGMVRSGNMVVVVSDMLQSVQVVEVP